MTATADRELFTRASQWRPTPVPFRRNTQFKQNQYELKLTRLMTNTSQLLCGIVLLMTTASYRDSFKSLLTLNLKNIKKATEMIANVGNYEDVMALNTRLATIRTEDGFGLETETGVLNVSATGAALNLSAPRDMDDLLRNGL